MSLADLGNALNGLSMNPMFNMGVGLMGASGPSLMPHSLGQVLASGTQYAQQAQMRAAQAQMMNYQMQQAALNNQFLQYAARMQQGAPNGQPEAAGQRSPQASNLNPPSTNAGDAPLLASANGTPGTSYATPQQQAQASQTQGSQGGGYDPFTSYLRSPTGAMQFVFDKPGFFNHVAPQPTDFVKTLQAAGIDPSSTIGRQLIQQNVAKQNWIAPTRITAGGAIYDPQTGRIVTMPAAAPAGFQNVQLPSGQWATIPVANGTNAVAAASTAQASGPATFKKLTYVDPKGVIHTTTASGFANGAGAPAPISANNPGALMPGGKLASYPTPQAGLQALDNNLASYGKSGINTLAGVISKWAPPGSNDTAAYIKDVSTRLGISPDQKIDLSNPIVRQAIGSAIMLHENGSAGVFGAAQPTSGAPDVAGPAPGLVAGKTSASKTAQGAPSQQMAHSYGALSNADSAYQSSRQALEEMIALAHNKGVTGGAVGLLPEGLATRVSPDAAKYQKLHATYVALQGKALGSSGTDAARETIDEAVPTYDKPQSAMVAGLQVQLNNLDLAHLKTQFLTPIYQQGNEKSYTQLSAGFDRNITPDMAPILQLSGEAQKQAVAAAIKQDPALKSRFEWAYNHGMLQ